MSELVEFKYVNNSLTTIPQSRLISKLATYFRIPAKQLREVLDKELIKEGVVAFNLPDNPINEDFYVASFRLNLNHILKPKKFADSEFFAQYTIMSAGKNKGSRFVVFSGSSLYILANLKDLDSSKGGGGIYIHYPPDLEDMVLLPIDTYLIATYPSPSQNKG
jgi:hypothetical protein